MTIETQGGERIEHAKHVKYLGTLTRECGGNIERHVFSLPDGREVVCEIYGDARLLPRVEDENFSAG